MSVNERIAKYTTRDGQDDVFCRNADLCPCIYAWTLGTYVNRMSIPEPEMILKWVPIPPCLSLCLREGCDFGSLDA